MNRTMQKEIPNNQPDWKQRLSQLDELPADSPVSLSASWEKLHDKLGTKKKNRKRTAMHVHEVPTVWASRNHIVYFTEENQMTSMK